jgi:hypothetical protein
MWYVEVLEVAAISCLLGVCSCMVVARRAMMLSENVDGIVEFVEVIWGGVSLMQRCVFSALVLRWAL